MSGFVKLHNLPRAQFVGMYWGQYGKSQKSRAYAHSHHTALCTMDGIKEKRSVQCIRKMDKGKKR
jgi:hypothetical protein